MMPAVVAVNCYVSGPYSDQSELVLSGSGSGAVISEDGYIVTNQHVIDGAARIVVVTSDSRSFEAGLVGEDRLTDLALLKIEQSGLSYIPLGNSNTVRVGETVLAAAILGYLKHTVTRGWRAKREIRVTFNQYAYAIFKPMGDQSRQQRRPLVNLRGELIRINSAKISGAEGIGLAVPPIPLNGWLTEKRRPGPPSAAGHLGGKSI